jgi:uncharacterized protein (DUF1778 family)
MGTERTARRKSERLEARIPPRQKSLLRRAAGIMGKSLTEFVISSATEAAQRVIREADVVELTERDQLAFAESLLAPPEASERLKRAASDYLEEVP